MLKPGRAVVGLAVLAASGVISNGGAATASTAPATFNAPGNVLIADQFNNRVVEIDRSHRIVWQFGLGPSDFSARSIIGVNDAQRVGTLTLMAGTGDPPGVVAACPTGCADNRVLLVDAAGRIVWQYGKFGVSGAGPNELNTPVQSTWLPDEHVLITDQANEQIIEVDMAKHIVWQYGTTGVAGVGANQLNNPNSAELLDNGHILISDENNNRAIEVTHTTPSRIVATFTAHGTTSGVAFASRLANGHTLLTDSNNSRIVEVDAHDNPVWQYLTNTRAGSNPAPLPTRAVRLKNGDTLISDQFNDQVLEVNTAKEIVSQVGVINTPGYNASGVVTALNAPYDAKVIGDYTGLTNPGCDIQVVLTSLIVCL